MNIGCVKYLNARPLVEGLDGVLFRPPSELGPLLESGRVDVALASSVEVLRRRWSYVPGIAVASPGKTDTVRLHHKVEIPDIRRVALDRNSKTSNVLVKVLLERRYGVKARFVTRDPSKGVSFRGVDAVVTIGDTSFMPARVPYLDLGTEWKALTGKPFVYALWAYLPGHPRSKEIAKVLRTAKSLGMKRIREIARREANRLRISPRFSLKYLTEYLSYDLGPQERAGMRLFATYARKYW